MLRFIAPGLPLLLVLCAPASAAEAVLWPQRLGPNQRQSSSGAAAAGDDRARWAEYGLERAETADYGAFSVTASQFKDTTGAYAASLEESGRKQIRAGNYLVLCRGKCPGNLAALADQALPRVSHAPAPILANYLPEKDRIPGTERYILGPLGLSAFAPAIPAAAAGFQFGSEGVLARYRKGKIEETLAIFNFPTPGMARQQAAEFQRTPGAEAKRSGPLVAVLSSASDPVPARQLLRNQLLNELNWQASVSWNEHIPIPVRPQSLAQMILAIFALAGIVLAFCVLSGLAFGAFLVLSKRFGIASADQGMIVLHLQDK